MAASRQTEKIDRIVPPRSIVDFPLQNRQFLRYRKIDRLNFHSDSTIVLVSQNDA